MLLVIPSIELSDGICCNRIIGEYGTDSLYEQYKQNPCELIRLWRRENAKSVHINDMDSFQKKSSDININGIIFLTEMTDIPLTLLHNFRDLELCSIFLNAGIYRIFIGKLFINYPYEISQLVNHYTSSRVCAYIDTDNTTVFYDNDTLKIPIDEVMKIIKSTGVNRILYHNRHWKDSVSDSDIESIKNTFEQYKVRITVNGGVNSASDLWKLNTTNKYGIDSVTIGQAFYQNKFPCQKIWRLVEAELEPNIINTPF